MNFFQRVGAGVKAFAMTFTGRTSSGMWSAVLGRAKYDANVVGDGTGNSIVQATLGWIARNFPEAPVRIREKDDQGEWSTTDDAGALRMIEVLRNPNAYFSGILLWMATIVDYWVHGNAFWVKVRGGPGGAITELWWIPWDLVEAKWPKDGSEYLSTTSTRPTAPARSGSRSRTASTSATGWIPRTPGSVDPRSRRSCMKCSPMRRRRPSRRRC